MKLTLEDFLSTQKRIAPYIDHTPLIEYPVISKFLKSKTRIFLKLENEQITNSFKPRGAFNALLSLSPEEKKRGIITRSSGNFAQAIAFAAHKLNIQATIVMATNVSEIKKQRTMQYHPKIYFAGTTHAEGNALVEKLAKEKNLCKLSPYDHLEVIEGQGTIALEIQKELPTIQHFFCPIGGGGLMGGCANAFKLLDPKIHIHGVEPKGADDYYQSRKQERPIAIKTPQTIADGLRANEVGKLNRPLLDQYVDTVDIVSDEEILSAMKFAKTYLDLVIETSAGAALAHLLFYSPPLSGDAVCVITGGNVDPSQYEQWMEHTQAPFAESL